MELDDEDRNHLLQMDAAKMVDVARFCNRYPNIELNYQVKDEEGREGPVSELVFFFFFVIFFLSLNHLMIPGLFSFQLLDSIYFLNCFLFGSRLNLLFFVFFSFLLEFILVFVYSCHSQGINCQRIGALGTRRRGIESCHCSLLPSG